LTDVSIPPDAFLVVQGGNAVPLDKLVTTIGRTLNNDLVLNDPRISRQHAKVSVIHNQFVLIDLDSSGGSYVNGNRVSKQILYPGDLISLAGLNLVFMQNSGLRDRASNPLPPPGE
jgi:pSer/pThr/pTyr-binding forkhead associated (FHA) protein